MTDLVLHCGERDVALPLPQARVSISIRTAVSADLAFIDELQKKHTKMVGWFPTKQIEANIAKGQVLIAEEGAARLGYCIAQDKYLKREELGIVYQLNVLPGKQRGLIGATLIKEVFNRAAYGCKLFCCWCAQDLEANHFWESIGFVPLAFRTGSRKAGQKKEPRIHIFWQRRIREGDTQTPYWFPSETSGGAVRENRLVLPIPPGTHWSDAKPAVLPGMEQVNVLPADSGGEVEKRQRKSARRKEPIAPAQPVSTGLWFGGPRPAEPTAEQKKAAKKKEPKPRFKNDPQLVAAARELRDRYTEQINAGLLLPPSACGKYDVSRQLEGAPSFRDAMKVEQSGEVRLLDAA